MANLTSISDLVIVVLTAAALLATLFFGLRAFSSRSQAGHEAYGVGQQEARIAMQVNITRAVVLLVVSLILLGVLGLALRPSPTVELPATAVPTATVTPVLPTATLTLVQPTNTAVTLPTQQPPTFTPAAATPEAAASPTAVATEATTTASQTATVSSGVGVWLRSAPGVATEQLEWVLDGTILTLLPGQETADEFNWQQVRTPDGNEGWVAVDFIVYNR